MALSDWSRHRQRRAFAPASALRAQLNPAAKWQTIKTQHFYVHFTKATEPQARRAAVNAERAYSLLASELVSLLPRVVVTCGINRQSLACDRRVAVIELEPISSAQRVSWLRRGLDSGRIESCDTSSGATR